MKNMLSTLLKRLPVALFRAISCDWKRPHWRILFYHGVSVDQRSTFADQLDWLSQSFQWCSLSEGVQAIDDQELDRPLLSLTFDDAERTVHDTVLPLLEQRGIRACVYVVPDYVERGISYRATRSQPIMNWTQLREWVHAGHEVGSHSLTHALLPRCRPQRIVQEVVWSRAWLQDRLGVPVRHFAYPWGAFDSRVEKQILTANDYDTLATTLGGSIDRRIRKNRLNRDHGNPAEPVKNLEKRLRMMDRLGWLVNPRTVQSLRRRLTRVPWEEPFAEGHAEGKLPTFPTDFVPSVPDRH